MTPRRYRIHVNHTGTPTHIVPGTYFRKAEARRGMALEAEQRYPDDKRRTSGPDAIVIWRNGIYRATISVERSE